MIDDNNSSKAKLTKDEVRNILWHQGILHFKLDPVQQELYKLFYEGNHKVMTWLLARRSGKTFALAVLAIEQCLRKRTV